MNRFLYSTLFTLALPGILIRLWRRSRVAPDYARRWRERLGRYEATHDSQSPANDEEVKAIKIWIHAVSVGETVAALPLINGLAADLATVQFVVTNTTPTGADMTGKLLGNRVQQLMSPYDTEAIVNRFLDYVQPDILIIMETELWPNMLHFAKKRGCKIVLANARLSQKSAQGYARFPTLLKQMFASIDSIAAQAEADKQRFLKLGYEPAAIHVTGSLKYIDSAASRDREARQGQSDSTGDELTHSPTFSSVAQASRTVVIAASTRDGEEEKVLTAFRMLLNEDAACLLVLVPRHPERFPVVKEVVKAAGFKQQNRSEDRPLGAEVEVLIGDSMAEMAMYYSLADIAFVGGSLVDTGCQNVIEPASLGLPVLTGPSQFNFQAVCDQLREAGALTTVSDEQQLGLELIALAREPSKRISMGAAGRAVVDANQDGLKNHLGLILPLLKSGSS